ncbi:MAG: Ig-like domain-containing protein, partial [Candidatus Peregrinibacteria bacterium]|nr:Ig-like domain-containing protein [Candidatus Peregrinibacteria bacterium]
MFKTKIKSLILALSIAAQAFAPAALAGYLNVRAYANDTVAGYASLLRSSVLTPGKDIVFVVEKPDTSVVRVDAEADLEGIARADLYGHQTKVAGTYKVALYYPGTGDASPQSTFMVYPDRVSQTQSFVNSTVQMVEADGVSRSFVTVTLYDAYRNPIKDHQVRMISSRTEDEVTAVNGGVTDEKGQANFKVTSGYPGVSVLTAMDASANVVLEDREEIVFYAPSSSGIGGNYYSTDMLQASIIQDAQAQEVLPGPVDHFEIEGLPAQIKVNTDQTMTIVAKDKDNNVAKNYTGAVLISTPDDENAILPNNGEYTFKEADQGSFTFNLALRFTTVGKQFIQVLDKNDWKIAGEIEVEVIPEQAITVPDVSASLVIKAPLDGAEFGSNIVVVSGQGNPNINLKVFDSDVKIGDTETDSDGFFSYQASGLSAGM